MLAWFTRITPPCRINCSCGDRFTYRACARAAQLRTLARGPGSDESIAPRSIRERQLNSTAEWMSWHTRAEFFTELEHAPCSRTRVRSVRFCPASTLTRRLRDAMPISQLIQELDNSGSPVEHLWNVNSTAPANSFHRQFR